MEESQPMEHKDYSLKQGEKIKVNLKVYKTTFLLQNSIYVGFFALHKLRKSQQMEH